MLGRGSVKWVFILPCIIYVLIFTIFPLVWSLGISLCEYTVGRGIPPHFNWGANYKRLFTTDVRLLHAFLFTLFYAGLATTVELFLGLGLASLFAFTRIKGEKFFRVLLRDGTVLFVYLCSRGILPLSEANTVDFWVLDTSSGCLTITRGVLERQFLRGIIHKKEVPVLLPIFEATLVAEDPDSIKRLLRVLTNFIGREVISVSEGPISVSNPIRELLFIGKVINDIRSALTPFVSSQFGTSFRPYNIHVRPSIILNPIVDFYRPITCSPRNNETHLYFLGYPIPYQRGTIPLIRDKPHPEFLSISSPRELNL